ncbi:type IV pilus modification PilV family protein [Pseudoalteromonas xiamenensis]|uniref:Prepilin-type N-terminal cleavage/methylation domain-containing protein n=1 Tax=Pseudoalteromonas xiamenensis TaxID=882626 RepID=A0A975DG13_9GAMM|nr:prepilin-type N-terminal cleavage/methylation domain-containing protein [Pseudoalteromonas xiamenensis]QTH70580.1 prepilin-type N-terminal cleavage/methylation domain-containing protein [Pseudoalteromonas xiamenensis]
MRLSQPAPGFSLLEVMVSIVVAGVALLGLAATQLKALQFATNSYYYSLALVQGQNAIERMWIEQCQLQHGVVDRYNEASFKQAIQPQSRVFELIMPNAFAKNMAVSVRWFDERMENSLDNQIRLSVAYPTLPNNC